METGTPDRPNPTPPTPRGEAEVHTRIVSADSTSAAGGEQSKTEQAKDKARDVADQAKDKADQVRGKAGELGGQAQDKLSEVLGRAQDALEERGLLDTIRGNPLPALGLAFGVGFLLAGSDDGGSHRGLSKAKNQLKGAVMGGLSATVAQEARSMLGMGGSSSSGSGSGILSSLMENLTGSSSGRGRSGGTSEPHRRPSHQEMA